MTKPTGRPRGRPVGSRNKAAKEVQEFAQQYTKAVVTRMGQMAGVIPVPLFNRDGSPKMVAAYNKDGSPKIDARRRPIMIQQEVIRPATSELAQISAGRVVMEYGVGKAVQALANDEENPLTDVRPNGKVVFQFMSDPAANQTVLSGPVIEDETSRSDEDSEDEEEKAA